MRRKGGIMGEVKELTSFFSAIREDNRIGTSHISLYMTLFQFYNLNQFKNPIEITRARVMEIAKISGLATYHKCMRDLAQFGYIQYMPSYNPALGSQVCLLKI
jgi:replication initiation and membrane attachment protein DnaB